MKVVTTHHGRARMKQRAISPELIDIIICFGRSIRRHQADVFYLTKCSRRRLRQQLGRPVYAAIEKKFKAYVVVSDDGTVITVGFRRHRMRMA